MLSFRGLIDPVTVGLLVQWPGSCLPLCYWDYHSGIGGSRLGILPQNGKLSYDTFASNDLLQ